MGQWGVSGVDFLPPQASKLACQHIACTPCAEKKKKKKKKKKLQTMVQEHSAACWKILVLASTRIKNHSAGRHCVPDSSKSIVFVTFLTCLF
jgi:hypothetical protein